MRLTLFSLLLSTQSPLGPLIPAYDEQFQMFRLLGGKYLPQFEWQMCRYLLVYLGSEIYIWRAAIQ